MEREAHKTKTQTKSVVQCGGGLEKIGSEVSIQCMTIVEKGAVLCELKSCNSSIWWPNYGELFDCMFYGGGEDS